MYEKESTALPSMRYTDSADELVGVLTAISVVSKRLAKKLTLLERSAQRGGERVNGNEQRASVYAD